MSAFGLHHITSHRITSRPHDLTALPSAWGLGAPRRSAPPAEVVTADDLSRPPFGLSRPQASAISERWQQRAASEEAVASSLSQQRNEQ
jgi:hypothetical protein